MTSAGRFIVRISGYVFYLLCIAATAVALFSDVLWLFWSGVFLALILLDRFIHLREGERLVSELPQSGSVNPHTKRGSAPSAPPENNPHSGVGVNIAPAFTP
ncbi:MAG: hypothetical protein Q7J22_00610, partial [Candidatus Wolfebacteria bacterium]|nr:hypothetical protein [Candidatus Wolfebacteria bacterium]